MEKSNQQTTNWKDFDDLADERRAYRQGWNDAVEKCMRELGSTALVLLKLCPLKVPEND